ncbi:hypothetical protein HMPREF9350_05657 [Escherichia coli MS 85-1]|uniref:Uncharacterized protein n=1 Tax=Escherichia coli MS 85-1 TaxID=679202 RepID=A0AAN3SC79_ECOLX|nr:hypothetical protein HMPREF9350_05657 [Escherichia coli MS 85-1]
MVLFAMSVIVNRPGQQSDFSDSDGDSNGTCIFIKGKGCNLPRSV